LAIACRGSLTDPSGVISDWDAAPAGFGAGFVCVAG
jgi:hypothetical protein